MSQNLVAGQNIPLGFLDVQLVVLTGNLPSGLVLDTSAFLLGSNGKVRTDDDFAFFNAPAKPQYGLFLDCNRHQLTVDLNRVQGDVQKIVLSSTIEEGVRKRQAFKDIKVISVQLLKMSTGEVVATFNLDTSKMSETALIFAELYRHKGSWKFRAVGQGFNGGLEPLCIHYGLNVAQGEGAVASPETPAQQTAPVYQQAAEPPRQQLPVYQPPVESAPHSYQQDRQVEPRPVDQDRKPETASYEPHAYAPQVEPIETYHRPEPVHQEPPRQEPVRQEPMPTYNPPEQTSTGGYDLEPGFVQPRAQESQSREDAAPRVQAEERPAQKQEPVPQQATVFPDITLERPGHRIRMDKVIGNRSGQVKIDLSWITKTSKLGSRIHLDLGCLYETKNDDKTLINIGCIQSLGSLFGEYYDDPYVLLDNEVKRTEKTAEQSLIINGQKWDRIHRILIYAFIYEGMANWGKADAVLTFNYPNQPNVVVPMDVYDDDKVMCAIAMIENKDGHPEITKLVDYFNGHEEMDKRYKFGLTWRQAS